MGKHVSNCTGCCLGRCCIFTCLSACSVRTHFCMLHQFLCICTSWRGLPAGILLLQSFCLPVLRSSHTQPLPRHIADLSPVSACVGTALHFWWFSGVWCSLPYASMAVIWSLIALLRVEKKTVSRKCCRAPGQGAASQQFPTGREVSALTLCWWNPWLIPTRFSSWNISDEADILRTLWSMTGNSMNCRAQEREAQLNK